MNLLSFQILERHFIFFILNPVLIESTDGAPCFPCAHLDSR